MMNKKQRKQLINNVISNINIEDIIRLEEAIEGRSEEQINRLIGDMTSNQWRSCLEISLNQMIFND